LHHGVHNEVGTDTEQEGVLQDAEKFGQGHDGREEHHKG
jgi:hypothetical protein